MTRTRTKFHSLSLAWIIALCFSATTAYAQQGALPSTPLPLLTGGSLNLQNLKGQVAVIRFLASW
jgi:hypothetical protein